jgi:hypothetical protein
MLHTKLVRYRENIGEFLSLLAIFAVGFGSTISISLGETILNNGDPNNVLINNSDVVIRTGEV